jgi:ornithine cyclodeaminase/alanine dehydrogenase-like protein (mu-crystallin family)
MGADSPDKQELDPALLRRNKVVVDLLEQCVHVAPAGFSRNAYICAMPRHPSGLSPCENPAAEGQLLKRLSGRRTGRRL